MILEVGGSIPPHAPSKTESSCPYNLVAGCQPEANTTSMKISHPRDVREQVSAAQGEAASSKGSSQLLALWMFVVFPVFHPTKRRLLRLWWRLRFREKRPPL